MTEKYDLDCQSLIKEHEEFVTLLNELLKVSSKCQKTGKATAEDMESIKKGMKNLRKFLLPHLAGEESMFNQKTLSEKFTPEEMKQFETQLLKHARSGPESPARLALIFYSLNPDEKTQFSTLLPWILKKFLLPFVFSNKIADFIHFLPYPPTN